MSMSMARSPSHRMPVLSAGIGIRGDGRLRVSGVFRRRRFAIFAGVVPGRLGFSRNGEDGRGESRPRAGREARLHHQ